MIYFISPTITVSNFADDTTRHACENDFNTLIMRLEQDALLTECSIEWYGNNTIKLNKDKSHNLGTRIGGGTGERKKWEYKTRITCYGNRKKS